MIKGMRFRLPVSLALIVSIFFISLPSAGYARSSAVSKSHSSDDLQKRLVKIEEKLEARRKELGIPGVSLAIVKDGQVVLSKGFGLKNFEKKIPVTGDTQFAIGSATKAFTALSVLLSRDEGKLSLEDSPQKYLPYFKIDDPEINKAISVKDLLTHSSGLNRTDLAWITGKLTREEIIRVAGVAKPTAKLGETFQYQNVMYAAAGEIVAKVQKTSWESFVVQHVLRPLGMTNTSVSVGEMQKAKDYSLGYEFNFDTKETQNLPTRDLSAIAPAGSINSSSNDMAKWLMFILNKGEVGGKRLVSEKGFEEWTKPQQKIAGTSSYGLGWFIQDWNGKKVIQHGGGIDGFNSMVALIPEENIGFVMLSNVSGSTLGTELMSIVWENMLGAPQDDKPVVSDGAIKEVGTFRFEAAGFDLEVAVDNGRLVAKVPNQPTYILENVGGRRYKLTNAPEGFFITFKDDSAFLEQPQGNYTLPKAGTEGKPGESSAAAKDLIGTYESEDKKGQRIEIKEVDGKVSLVVGVQPPYPLVEKEKNVFRSPLLPDTYSVKARRDSKGKLEGIILAQPEGEFPFTYRGKREAAENPKEIFGTYKLDQPPAYDVEIFENDGKTYLQVPNQPPYLLQKTAEDIYFSPTLPDVLKKIEIKRNADGNVVGFVSNEPGGAYSFKKIKIETPAITAVELMTKAVDALGGEENMRKISSRITRFDIDFTQQGVSGYGTSWAAAPNKASTDMILTALGKEIGSLTDYFDGAEGGESTSFSREEIYTGQRLEDVKFSADFYSLLDMAKDAKSVEIKGIQKFGDEEVYNVRVQPEKASAVTYYISTKSYLPVGIVSVVVSSTSPQRIPVVQKLSDYRLIDGVMIPFRLVTTHAGMGDIVVSTKEVKHNAEINEAKFKARK